MTDAPTARPKWDRSDFMKEDEEAGIPWENFVTALGVWIGMRPDGKDVTVRHAADEFGVTDDVIRAAAEEHYWMFLYGPADDSTEQMVGLDGE